MSKAHPHSPRTLESQDALFLRAMSMLKESGYKRTMHRETLVRFFIMNPGPLTTENIQTRTDGLDKVTIYRSLASFESLGLLRRIDFGDGLLRYELNLNDEEHHHHVICTQCGKVDVVHHCEVSAISQIETQTGYRSIRHSLEFFGLCPQCQ